MQGILLHDDPVAIDGFLFAINVWGNSYSKEWICFG